MNNLVLKTDVDFKEYLIHAQNVGISPIRGVNEYRDSVDALQRQGMAVHGKLTPWGDLNHMSRLNAGELSIWAGRSGSGKSQILGQAIAWRLEDQKAVIVSLEMKPEKTILKMINQSAGCEAGSTYMNKWIDRMTGRLWLYDKLERIEVNEILGLAHYVFGEMEVDHFVIDSLTKCGIRRDDYNAEKDFIDQLQTIAKRYQKHIHLVCHMRKSQDGFARDSIRGAGEITDLSDNVFILERNREKEQHPIEKQDEPDAVLVVAKNREFGEEGVVKLGFHKQSGQFTNFGGLNLTIPYPVEGL
jgi:twinkle protein